MRDVAGAAPEREPEGEAVEADDHVGVAVEAPRLVPAAVVAQAGLHGPERRRARRQAGQRARLERRDVVRRACRVLPRELRRGGSPGAYRELVEEAVEEDARGQLPTRPDRVCLFQLERVAADPQLGATGLLESAAGRRLGGERAVDEQPGAPALLEDTGDVRPATQRQPLAALELQERPAGRDAKAELAAVADAQKEAGALVLLLQQRRPVNGYAARAT